MKTIKLVSAITFLFLTSLSFSQTNKIIIDDQSGIINSNVRSHLIQALTAQNISLEEYLDYEKRCEFTLINLQKVESEIFLTAKNCDKLVVGEATFSEDLKLTDEKSIGNVIAKEIVSILNTGEVSKNSKQKPSSLFKNHHDTRYFFAPSAFNLKKGELYYNTAYFLVHDLQYGLTDNFSVGLGTTIIGLPAYLTPKLSIPVSDNVSLMVGDLFIFGTYGVNFVANIAYGGVTIGSSSKNITIAGGALVSTEAGPAPVFNVSSTLPFSNYFSFVTENYFSTDLFGGFTGIRIITKTKDVQSFQLGFTYFGGVFNNPIVLPGLAYTVKFGRVY
jgi:hypothetical protein